MREEKSAMRTYNLFNRTEQEELVCAVPEDWPVPSFIRGPPWEFAGRLEGTSVPTRSFNREAAATSVRYNGFYLFQLINRSDLQPHAHQRSSKGAIYQLPQRRTDLPREIPLVPTRRRAAMEQDGAPRQVRARWSERFNSEPAAETRLPRHGAIPEGVEARDRDSCASSTAA